MIPNYHGNWPIEEYPEFCDFIKDYAANGGEVVLHGLTHLAEPSDAPKGPSARFSERFLTDNEGEFLLLEYGAARKRIEQGIEKFERALGCKPKGFIAPAWLEHRETGQALRDLGLEFHESHVHIHRFEADRKFIVPAVTFTGRSPSRALASTLYAELGRYVFSRGFSIRMALHPADFHYEYLVRSIERLLKKISERLTFVDYASFFEKVV